MLQDLTVTSVRWGESVLSEVCGGSRSNHITL